MTIEAATLYGAIFTYNDEVAGGRHAGYPKLQNDTEIEVRLDDGCVLDTTFGKALAWANRRAENGPGR